MSPHEARDTSEPGEVSGTDARRTRSSGLRLVALLGVAVLAAVLLGQLTTSDPRPTTAITPTPTDTSTRAESLRPCPLDMGGLALSEGRLIGEWPVEMWDCQALTEGPWSLVIRGSDGQFGLKSAVVTYPVDHEGLGTAVTRPRGSRWDRNAQTLVFPMGGSYAQIVGDLGLATLAELAMRTTDGRDGNADGRPHFLGLKGFAASAVTTFRSPVLNEIRYETRDLGVAKLGKGQIWTGVMRGRISRARHLRITRSLRDSCGASRQCIRTVSTHPGFTPVRHREPDLGVRSRRGDLHRIQRLRQRGVGH